MSFVTAVMPRRNAAVGDNFSARRKFYSRGGVGRQDEAAQIGSSDIFWPRAKFS